MRARLFLPLLPVLVVAAASFVLAGCNRSPAEPSPPGADASAPVLDGGGVTVADAGEDGGIADAQPLSPCFTNPTTYLQIINACTDAQAVDKVDDLSSMNLADGGLQPLP